MLDVEETPAFKAWREALPDDRTRSRIAGRIARVALGLLSDAKSVGGGGELRVDHGPGYRLYFTRRRQTVVILLRGDDKGTQARDIRLARSIASDL